MTSRMQYEKLPPEPSSEAPKELPNQSDASPLAPPPQSQEPQPQVFLPPLVQKPVVFYAADEEYETKPDNTFQSPSFVLFAVGFFIPCVWFYLIYKYHNSPLKNDKRWVFWSIIALVVVFVFYCILTTIIVLA
ncbi:hypothetical protein EIN_085080 [Entamoeba invadens IP1]|uniref:hypothetical protein n=1 Tax=Entamoeba invadens IP1 TaxID=370355 RepID=UPI0002C3F023|nr:hypothetical protein EIN_085080 [Entamoeba invadens IP1]ELP85296.1 hypothetical protein EIN_085080 [Entamoeba invadens IP1]|eukprot:XP_004184642.1 hypothetical protein EIN_085080 [Entamoeba invadens IP1]